MLAIALAFNLLVFLLACVAMMAAFLGGGGYLPALIVILGLSLPVTLAMALAGIGWFMKSHGWRDGLRAAWRHLPQWLVVACWLALALVFCGELALIVTLRLAETPPAPWQHLPLLAGLFATVAFCVIEALRRR